MKWEKAMQEIMGEIWISISPGQMEMKDMVITRMKVVETSSHTLQKIQVILCFG